MLFMPNGARSPRIASGLKLRNVASKQLRGICTLRYAMSLPVAVTISGMEAYSLLERYLEVAHGFQPLSAAEMQHLRDRSLPLAVDGRLELFKTTKKYDGDLGREQHHFPPASELPA